jgi:cell division septal protein FtsQ
MIKRKPKLPLKLPLKLLAGLAAVTLILALSVVILSRAARNSSLFRVRDIVIREGNTVNSKIDLSFLVGRNIMAIDLEQEERNIAVIYPGYRQIRLIRVFPDRLFAYFVRRQPIACVKLYRYFYVDNDAALFDLPADAAQPANNFPVIYGLDRKISGPQAGRRYNLNELLLGVNIIKAVRNSRQLRGLRIKSIDVTNPDNAAFTILLPAPAQAVPPDGIEIRIGQGYLNDKMNILASLLIQGRNDWDNIKYIDLRFKEPVIKFNEKKDKKK